jgi:hypothetical protein
VLKEVHPTLDLGRLRAKSLPEGLVDLIMKLSIPDSELQNFLGYPQYLVYQSSMIQNMEV